MTKWRSYLHNFLPKYFFSGLWGAVFKLEVFPSLFSKVSTRLKDKNTSVSNHRLEDEKWKLGTVPEKQRETVKLQILEHRLSLERTHTINCEALTIKVLIYWMKDTIEISHAPQSGNFENFILSDDGQRSFCSSREQETQGAPSNTPAITGLWKSSHRDPRPKSKDHYVEPLIFMGLTLSTRILGCSIIKKIFATTADVGTQTQAHVTTK